MLLYQYSRGSIALLQSACDCKTDRAAANDCMCEISVPDACGGEVATALGELMAY